MKTYVIAIIILLSCSNVSAAVRYNKAHGVLGKLNTLPTTQQASCTDTEKKMFSKYMKYNSAYIASSIASDLFKKETLSYMKALSAAYNSKATDDTLCSKTRTICDLEKSIPAGGIELFEATCADGAVGATIDQYDCAMIF